MRKLECHRGAETSHRASPQDLPPHLIIATIEVFTSCAMCFEELPAVDPPTCCRIVEGSIERGVQFGAFLRAQVVAVDDCNVDISPVR